MSKEVINKHFRPEEIQQLFFGIFSEIPFPFYAADLRAIQDAKYNDTAKVSHFGVRIPASNRNPEAFVGAWLAIFEHLQLNVGIIKFFADSPMAKATSTSNLLKQIASTRYSRNVTLANGSIFWEESTPWPLVFSTFLSQLYNVSELSRLALSGKSRQTSEELQRSGWDASNAQIAGHYSKVMPTQWHYAAASLGEWTGGSVNCQYFGFYATRPQIRNSNKNVEYAKSVQYSESDAKILDEGGLIAIPLMLATKLLLLQGDMSVLGGIGINEFNAANPPANLEKFANAPTLERPGFLVDKYYRAPFVARDLTDEALYGSNNVFRDHYQEFYANQKHAGLLRCKHYCAPIIDISSVDDLYNHLEGIPKYDSDNGIFFRGSTSGYSLKRSEGVRKLLFGNSCDFEPSLLSTADRTSFDCDYTHFSLKYFLENNVLGVDSHLNFNERKWRELCKSPLCEIDYAVMALAQHYGIPTHGLDITTDASVAAWFATHTFHRDSHGKCSYRKISASKWPTDPMLWPMIYVCQQITHSVQASFRDCTVIEDFGLVAARPLAQSGKFFLGGYSDHQNRLAETLICAFRLKPSHYTTGHSFDLLFPSPLEDPAYQIMLDFARHPELNPHGVQIVNCFHS